MYKFDKFVDKKDEERKKELDDYKKFVYIYEDVSSVVPEKQQRFFKQQLVLPELQIEQPEQNVEPQPSEDHVGYKCLIMCCL